MNIDSLSAAIESEWRLLSLPVARCFQKYGDQYRQDANMILAFIDELCARHNHDYRFVLKMYSNYVENQIHEQALFSKSGAYRFSSEEEVNKEMGKGQENLMYMYVLALSYILALHRYELLLYVRKYVRERVKPEEVCLQIGTGVGLEAHLFALGEARMETFDINPYTPLCLEIWGNPPLVRHYSTTYDFQEENRYDHCLLVEILEHLQDPLCMLRGAERILRSGGTALLTFALRMPQIDHIFLFRSVSQARELIAKSHFEIRDEAYFISSFMKIPDEDKAKLAESSRLPCVYACVVGKMSSPLPSGADPSSDL